MHIKLKNKKLYFLDYKIKCAIGKSGISAYKREGDGCTPKGIFKFKCIFYRKDKISKIKTKLKKIVIKKNMGWCDDSRSRKYNQEIKFPFQYNAEKLFKKDRFYDIFINIKYNQNPVKKGKGSAIFLHLTNKKYKPTNGCIAVLKKDLLKVLPHINKKTKISIT